MIFKAAQRCLHCGVLLIEFAAFALLILAVLMMIFIGLVRSGPLEIGFAKDYIESALYDEVTGNYVLIDKVSLYWPDLQGALFLQLQGARLLSSNHKAIVSVDEAAISFSRSSLFLGKIRPKSIILKTPSLRITRGEGNVFDLGFGPSGDIGATFSEGGRDKRVGVTSDIFEYIARPGRESARNSLISRLEAFEINDAKLIVEDHVLGLSWYLPKFNAGFFSTETGMNARFGLVLPDVGGRPSLADIKADYDWDAKETKLQANIQNFDLEALAAKMPYLDFMQDQDVVLNARLDAQLDKNFIPMQAEVSAHSADGFIYHPDFSSEAVPYKDLKFLLKYDVESGMWHVRDTSVTVEDVTVKAGIEFAPAEEGAHATVNLHIDEVAQSAIDQLWPEALRGDSSEEWIVHKMSEGVFRDLNLSFGLSAHKAGSSEEDGEGGWDAKIKNLTASFGFTGMSVDYRAPLPIVTGAEGSGTFDMNHDEMVVDIDKAKLGKIDVTKAHLLFDRVVEEGAGGVRMEVGLLGRLTSVLDYLSHDPIHLDEDTDFDFKTADGDAALTVNLAFPTRKDVKIEDFTVGVEGTLKDVTLPDLVGDLDMSGGPMAIKVVDGKISATGEGLLEKRAVKFTWEEFLESEGKPYIGKVEASLVADPTLRQRLGIDLDDFIEGPLPVQVNYTSYHGGKSVAKVTADLTPALFFVSPFDFEKKPGEKASSKFTAILKNKELIEIKDLSAKGTNFEIFPAWLKFAKDKSGDTGLQSGDLPKFVLGETRGKLGFQFDKSGAVKMVLDCPFLDVRPFLDVDEEKKAYEAPPMIISVDADVMRTADEETVSDARLYIDIDGEGRFNQMEMDAKAGAGQIYLRFKPDKEGKRVFRLETEDAGAALKAFQVYKNIRGGKLVVYAEPIRGVFDRNLSGIAEISDFKAVNAPVLAKLLGIMSLTGLPEALSGEGLSFSKLEASFNWVYRRNGSLLVLKEGRTSGNSIGLTFDGTFDNAAHRVDVNGTIIPMSGVNEFIGNIPLVGDILTGGSGGVIAATYSVKGASSEPNISVNPLSVLTPGILRRILFE